MMKGWVGQLRSWSCWWARLCAVDVVDVVDVCVQPSFLISPARVLFHTRTNLDLDFFFLVDFT